MMTPARLRSALGTSLLDIMMTVAITATILAISVPAARNTVDTMRLGGSAREVERELQSARLKAVSTNRPIRLRFNCPAAGQFRMVEVTGVTATDADTQRCDPNKYGYPGPKDTDQATPAHDGPLHTLHSSVSVSGSDLQFWPDGTTRTVSGSTLATITAPVTITLSKDGSTSRITINAMGKIQLQ